ncbi:MAG: hypothetical protein ACRDWN_01835 [Acidimicrobiales bacterium]
MLLLAGFLIWAGQSLLLGGTRRGGRRRGLVERLAPYQPPGVAEEAAAWLDDHGGPVP